MPSKSVHFWQKGGISSQVGIGALGLVLFVLVVGVSVKIGYSDDARPYTGFGDKKLWDWMDVLGVPLTVALLVFFGGIVAQRAGRRASLERELEESRSRQSTLQSYLDTMTNLILERKLNRPHQLNNSAKEVAYAQTLATLRALDGGRKGLVVRFLYESKLIRTPDPIVPLNEADLTEADLANVVLEKVDFSGANLARADLSVADLSRSSLVRADLTEAQLASTNLREAHLDGADMSGANLNDAELEGAHLTDVDLTRADLTLTTLLSARMGGADLSDAVLKKTNLTGANLSDAVLNNADLSEAIFADATLVGADFINAVLTGADFRNADCTAAKLGKDQMASMRSLSGATMPDGSTLTEEDWPEFKTRHLLGRWRRMTQRLQSAVPFLRLV